MKRNDLVARSLTLGLAVATAAVTQISADKKAGISAATVAQITEAAGNRLQPSTRTVQSQPRKQEQ